MKRYNLLMWAWPRIFNITLYKYSILGNRLKGVTPVGADRDSNPHQSRPKPVTTTGAGMREQPQREQAWATDLWGTGPKSATSMGAASRKQPPWNQAQASDLCISRPQTGTSVETGWASDFCQSWPKQATSSRAGLSQWPLWEKVWLTFTTAEQSLDVLNDLQKCQVNSDLTGTMVLTQPWKTTIWTFDPLEPGRMITRKTTQLHESE